MTTEVAHHSRFAVIDLTNYQYFRANDQEVDEFVRRLRRLDPPTPQMRRGEELHRGLQLMALGETEEAEALLSTFEWAIDHDVAMQRPSRVERPVSRVYEVGGRSVLLVGRVDAIARDVITDYKATGRIDLDSLHDSLQWRSYLDMLPECNVFRYEVFRLGLDLDSIIDHAALELRRYPDLHKDVAEAVEEVDWFVQSLASQGLVAMHPDGNGVVRG